LGAARIASQRSGVKFVDRVAFARLAGRLANGDAIRLRSPMFVKGRPVRPIEIRRVAGMLQRALVTLSGKRRLRAHKSGRQPCPIRLPSGDRSRIGPISSTRKARVRCHELSRPCAMHQALAGRPSLDAGLARAGLGFRAKGAPALGVSSHVRDAYQSRAGAPLRHAGEGPPAISKASGSE